MKQKRTSKDTMLVAQVLDAYLTYVRFGYPKDPGVYRVRADTTTAQKLEALNANLLYEGKGAGLFMGFLIEVVPCIPTGDVVFGPETLTFDWS